MDIKERIILLLDLRGMTRAELARATGFPQQTVYSALRSGKNLSFDLVARIAQVLEVSLDTLAGKAPGTVASSDTTDLDVATDMLDAALARARSAREYNFRDERLSLEEFLNWWEHHSGRLENADKILEYADIFAPPDSTSGLARPKEMGRLSLASVCFSVENAEHMGSMFQGFSRPLNQQVVSAHISALQRAEPVISYPEIDVNLPDGSRFKGAYRRVLAPIKDGAETLIINFAQPLPGRPLLSFPPLSGASDTSGNDASEERC